MNSKNLSLTDALDRMPKLIGRTITDRTLRRWITVGIEGRKLQTYTIAGKKIIRENDLIAFTKPRKAQ